ncbi:MAG TPA: AAA family ATPase, partial [Actinomycetes bacterium]|nr:AAA family ATPase [Actinomycetes bacterium]
AVGDIEQLPEIEAGGLFRSLVRRLGAAELHTNHRQREAWEQQALDLLRSGDAIAAIARYAQHDRVVVRSRAGRLRNRMVQDWWAATQRPGEHPPIMIALRHRDVADLNAAARKLLAKHGRIAGTALRVGDRRFAIGDRIITLRNARQLGVLNGTFATVTGINHHAKSLRIHTDDGHDLVLPRWYLEHQTWFHHRRQIDHAYTVTCHKAQGMTTDRVFVLTTDDIYQQWGYVALSRGRLENRLYLAVDQAALVEELDLPPEPTRDAVLDLTATLERPRSQYLALDQLPTTNRATPTAPSRSDTGDDLRPTPQRPPRPPSPTGNPQQDLAALRALHRACSIDLLHAQEQIATQRPGWRQRRLLSRTIVSAEHTLADLDHQISQAQTTGNEHPPAPSHAAANPTTGGNPPRYLVAALGGWPRTQPAQAVWRIAANQIDAYRLRAGAITLQKFALSGDSAEAAQAGELPGSGPACRRNGASTCIGVPQLVGT